MAAKTKNTASSKRQVSALVEPLQLASIGAATYLSYWTLFFAICRACSGRQGTGRG
jgi:hypothetical protein